MSFFNKLFHKKKQEENLERNPKEASLESATQSVPPSTTPVSEISAQADTPLPFGYKIGWLAIKGTTPE